MIFVLDNYDSFTYNLVQYLGELGADPVVRRNDEVTVGEIEAFEPGAILISPGPGAPRDAGISVDLIRATAGRTPLLGVCLGHQAIGEAFGGHIVPAERLMHGKTSPISHTGQGIFRGVSSPLTAMRYHSLLVDSERFPEELRVTAWTADRPEGSEIMGLEHRELPIFGVQFHPESIGTAEGKQLLRSFLEIVGSA